MNELALFAGAGGGILASQMLGWRTVCAVERNAFAAGVLIRRQNDKLLPPFPVWDNVVTFDGKGWRGLVDVVSGGFPCQDISAAGKGAGIEGESSGLWVEMARVIREVRPRYVFVENSPILVSRGLGRVLGDLAEMGFNARWGVLGAWHVGAPHQRDRIWIAATHPERIDLRHEQQWKEGRWHCLQAGGEALAGNDGDKEPLAQSPREAWAVKSGVGRVAHGLAHRMDRLRCLGDGQVPAVAALAWKTLKGEEDDKHD